MISFGNEEIAKTELMTPTATCPNCGKEHKAEESTDEKGRGGGLWSISCPDNDKVYLVGIKGRKL